MVAPKDGRDVGNDRFSCLFNENILITIREGAVPAIERNLAAVPKQPDIISRGVGVLLYNLLDAAIDFYNGDFRDEFLVAGQGNAVGFRNRPQQSASLLCLKIPCRSGLKFLG